MKIRNSRLTKVALAFGLVVSVLGQAAGVPDNRGRGRSSQRVSQEPIVTVTGGRIQGKRNGTVSEFKGIPYAEPPTGALRWLPPVAKKPWTNIRRATLDPNACPQTSTPPNGTSPSVTGNEDCLYLNVWAPDRQDSKDRLPVMVFVHGGGAITGSATDKFGDFLLYDATKLAEDGKVIVVVIQYRLGMLGFLALPGLRDEQATGTTGNYGQLDKILALEWVKANAAAFGGDPTRTTIFGESNGAWSVCALVASPLASGLFSGAITQSGVCGATPLAAAFASGAEFTRSVGCEKVTNAETLNCLRGLPIATLVQKQPTYRPSLVGTAAPYGSTIDGYFLPSAPLEIIQAGRHNHVPVIMGSNLEEEAFSLIVRNEKAVDELASFAPTFGAENYEKLRSYYPVSFYGSSERAAVVALTDIGLTCPIKGAASKLQQSSSSPVYGYYYTHTIGGTAVFSTNVNTSATISTTITISGPLGEYKKQVPFVRRVSTSQTLSESKPMPDIAPMHGFELPFVFQRWAQWEKWLTKQYTDRFQEELPALQATAQTQAEETVRAQATLAIQQEMKEMTAALKAAQPLLGRIKIDNTSVKITNLSTTVTNPVVKLKFAGGEAQVQQAFLRHWTNFARSGNPSEDWNSKFYNGAPGWPRLTSSEITYFEINATQRALSNFKQQSCGLIDGVFGSTH